MVLEVLVTTFREEKEIERVQLEKKEVKLLLFVDVMILYTENPKDATRKLPEIINEFGKATDTKFIYRNLLHFYALTMKYQKEIKETMPFISTSKRIK